MRLQKYSIGTGDRFGSQGKAQLEAIKKAHEKGVEIAIVWNKSHREHLITNTSPADVLKEAQEAVEALSWNGEYYIDADHVNLSNIELFIDPSNYFTLDVAEYINKKASDNEIHAFIEKYKVLIGDINISNIKEPLKIDKTQLRAIAEKYLFAIKQAGQMYHLIEDKKGKNNFIIEVSMDETEKPQTPIEILFILAAIADESIPIQTIAPKFSGKFNKGVDYEGNINQFSKEFETILAVIQFAVQNFSLPDNLKISLHSGSDKFSLYKIINILNKKFDAGFHLKTSGTTWLEELIGLAIAGDDGLDLAKEIYFKAYNRLNELCAPYSAVIDINIDKLPQPELVNKWTSENFVKSLRHDLSCKEYNRDFRQLLHIAYKIAAEMGSRYISTIKKYDNIITKNVTNNIYDKHLSELFL
ncbi:MAG: tagaturonate epimerase family protein [Candidatus Hermodarchaeota archaeon]